jgi:hypothetical protein
MSCSPGFPPVEFSISVVGGLCCCSSLSNCTGMCCGSETGGEFVCDQEDWMEGVMASG